MEWTTSAVRAKYHADNILSRHFYLYNIPHIIIL